LRSRRTFWPNIARRTKLSRYPLVTLWSRGACKDQWVPWDPQDPCFRMLPDSQTLQ
jgi:hypothetical protein